MIVPLEQALDAAIFGGKASQLAAAIRRGLPVPGGYAVSVAALDALSHGDGAVTSEIADIARSLGGALATRSSAIGEDGAGASFAGQHVTVLNLSSPEAVIEGLREVHQSAHDAGALAYRQKRNIEGPVRIAAVIQKLVDPVCAGVMFTRHPVTGSDERVVEAAWGLGEAVVQGLVTPDHYRIARDGRILERRLGDKPTAVRCLEDGRTGEIEVAPELVEAPCVTDAELARLCVLASHCEAAFGRDLDLEWALADGELYLLQSRPITTHP